MGGARQRRLQAEAAALGVTAQVVVQAAPMVLTGVCDGRAFYLRERHGSWHVTIATDDDPLADPWASPLESPSIDIASGEATDFQDDEGRSSRGLALRVTVAAVRARFSATHPRMRSLSRPHIATAGSAVFCSPRPTRGVGRPADLRPSQCLAAHSHASWRSGSP